MMPSHSDGILRSVLFLELRAQAVHSAVSCAKSISSSFDAF
jgi:hypothetical protein